MYRKLKEIHKDQSGAALIFVLLALVIISVFATAIVSIVHANVSQATSQEDEVKAYYLALSGTDLCYAALLQEGIEGDDDTLLHDHFIEEVSPTEITDTLALEGGSVAISVRAFDKSSERWVEIKATATLDSSSVTKTATLQFLASNPIIQVKS